MQINYQLKLKGYVVKGKVALIIGTRPEAIKLLPVYFALKNSTLLEPVLISTGQHKEMLASVFSMFSVTPDIELKVMTGNQTLSELTATLFVELGKVFSDTDYKCVLVQGDTTTALVGALSAHYHKIQVGHVEAGLRTGNKWSPFPEESNRKLIGSIADFHFSPTKVATDALLKENITTGVYQVGNTVVDSLLAVLKLVDQDASKYTSRFSSLFEPSQNVVLVTGHRRESFGEGFKQICMAISQIARNNPLLVIVYPVHLNPNVRTIVYKELGCQKNIHLIDPLPYDEMIYLMKRSWLILTDSGGIQEEAPTLNVPLIVMRDVTERQEGIDCGCAVLAGVSAENIYAHFLEISGSADLYGKMANVTNPYGDGDSGMRIVEILETHF